MAAFDVVQIPALQDNYIYLVREPNSGAVAVIDPAEDEPVRAALAERGWTPELILNTHHHFDHIGGNAALKQRFGCRIIGPAADTHRIPEMDAAVREGDTVTIGAATGQVLETPGHTSGHISFYFPEQAALFCGDTLFALGCGRLFEGTPEQMWQSLSKLKALPDETLVYCAHEYTEANAAFARSIDPDNGDLARRADQIAAQRRADRPTVPSRLADEKATNPFLRPDDPAIVRTIGLSDADTVRRFAEIRARKDRF
ncbi:MAG: hydroxyacylglutathione hydrolase [Rhodothalassiaceae bacterium]